MSLDKFITQILNIKEEDLEEITPIMQSNGSSIIKIRLKARSTICPYRDGKVKIHGYYTRRLKHAALTNKKCIIVYQQRRYKCCTCEATFHEQNPFINTRESLTFETKVNILNDLKWPEITYSYVAKRYDISKTKQKRFIYTLKYKKLGAKDDFRHPLPLSNHS
jgi:transposase